MDCANKTRLQHLGSEDLITTFIRLHQVFIDENRVNNIIIIIIKHLFFPLILNIAFNS